MKILFLTRRFFPDVGGVETHVLEISKELISRGHEVVILTETAPKDKHTNKRNYQSIEQSDTYYINSRNGAKSSQTAHFEPHLIKIISINTVNKVSSKKMGIWREMYKRRELISQADVVHCHDVFFWYLPFRFLYPTKKIFTTFHGYETNFPPKTGAIFIRKISEMLSNGNICVGEYIHKWYGTNYDYLTYGGVNKKNKSKKVTNNKVEIVFVGRIERDVGVNKYLSLLKELRDKNISFNFTAIGDGSLKNSFKKYGKVIGFVKNPESYISNSDIVFASSYLSMLEALIEKKDVVAVYDNDLKKDYLEMSPFKNYVNILGPKDELKSLDGLKIKGGFKWASEQTWGNVTDIYLRLWNKTSEIF
ncbi:MAG TPA: glycosyltransferase family 4 protein [Patescibacteria group bacterium]|nr:glycosyltransferase family 4 protein [Patescibacteria group bacterium]